MFVERENARIQSVKIMTDPYAGVIYSYGQVRVIENPQLGNATLSFQYTVESTPPNQWISQLSESPEFRNRIGDILADILLQRDIRIGKNGNKSTNNDTKQLSPQ